MTASVTGMVSKAEFLAENDLPPTVEVVNDPIAKTEGSRQVFSKGRDYEPVRALVIASRYQEAKDGEKHLYIGQNKGTGGISISLKTLEDIVQWAKAADSSEKT